MTKSYLFLSLAVLLFFSNAHANEFECRSHIDFVKIAHGIEPFENFFMRLSINSSNELRITRFQVWNRQPEETAFLKELNADTKHTFNPMEIGLFSKGHSKITVLVWRGSKKQNPWNFEGDWYSGLIDIGILPEGSNNPEEANLFESTIWCHNNKSLMRQN